ncbi:hypothetical protein RFI_11791 [Reticulomyxa filosa]|uniref:Uncharacterized protein n=1 Tax=Reticulomyxa filosa TaxID=46433 RepID=X6NG91_RETFI|nr:hypothetical protein RFI_11791 [Reticulomyxa filosa]|eukprot:ETO25345.1 hypothetical protein RFI_11791 [Reticulomyxa filosa]
MIPLALFASNWFNFLNDKDWRDYGYTAKYEAAICITGLPVTFFFMTMLIIFVNCYAKQWTVIPLVCGRLSLYVFFSQRFYQSFRRTNLRVRLFSLCSLSLFACTTIVLMATAYLYMLFVRTDCVVTRHAKIPILIAAAQDICWGCILTGWFAHKLSKTIQLLIKVNEHTQAAAESSMLSSMPSSTPLTRGVPTYTTLSPTCNMDEDSNHSATNTNSLHFLSFFTNSPNKNKKDVLVNKQKEDSSLVLSMRKQTFSTQQKMLVLVYLIFKLVILMIVSIAFTALCFIWWSYYIATLSYSLEVCISSTCLVLSFNHHKRYYRCCCYPCRFLFCEIYFMNLFERKSETRANRAF